jgi:hypothetical protein
VGEEHGLAVAHVCHRELVLRDCGDEAGSPLPSVGALLIEQLAVEFLEHW